MAFLDFKNVKIAGLSAGVPKQISCNLDMKETFTNYDVTEFIKTTGVYERRIDYVHTTSDLCIAAAERLIEDLHWDRKEIEAIIFVSQSNDYILPATACVIQDKMGLTKECYAEDIGLGCSGWVYGLSTVSALMANGSIKKALLMAGDAKPRILPTRETMGLFGYSGTVTALEYVEGEEGFKFHFGTDGSGFDAIIVPDGGARNPVTLDSFIEEEIDGRKYNRLQSRMKGMDVFTFGITTAPKSIKGLGKHYSFDYKDADYFVFHQANMKMNNMIAKLLKLPAEKVPSSMYHFGNTSSASIPLTIVTQLKNKIKDKPTKFICCGFGVGLSWGTVAFESKNIVISDLVEL